MAELQEALNFLAGTTGMDAQGAANVWAGTTGMDLLGVLNYKSGNVGLGIRGALAAMVPGAAQVGLGVNALCDLLYLKPSVPRSITATPGASAGTVDVSWLWPSYDAGFPFTTGNSVGAAAYSTPIGGNVVKSVTTAFPATTGTITALTSGVTYYVNVRCKNNNNVWGLYSYPRIPVVAT